jgi:hypothetical protein
MYKVLHFFPPITNMKRHNSEKHFTDIHSIFQRTGLFASKVSNWKTDSYTSIKKQTLNRAQANKNKNIALGALTPCVSHQHKCT